MKKFLCLFLICFSVLTAFVSCSSDPKTVDSIPTLTLYTLTSNTDAIDVFTAGPGLTWATTTTNVPDPSVVPLRIIAKRIEPQASATNFKGCFCDKQWVRDDSAMMPATYHYFTCSGLGDGFIPAGSLLKIQIQCLNETQGLCVAKFSAQYIDTTTKSNLYNGTWEIQIGTPNDPSKYDDTLKEVLYKANVVIK